jgi:hypothetical protein
VRFEADLQVASGASNVSAAFKIDSADGKQQPIAVEGLPLTGGTVVFTRSVGSFDVGIRTLTVEPIANLNVGGQECEEVSTTRRVKVIEHPMQINQLQYGVDRRIRLGDNPRHHRQRASYFGRAPQPAHRGRHGSILSPRQLRGISLPTGLAPEGFLVADRCPAPLVARRGMTNALDS